MAIAFVQEKQNTTTTATTIAATFTSNTTTGNLIFVAVSAQQACAITGIADGANTYTQLFAKSNSASTMFTEIWIAKNITGGVTPTVTATLTASVRGAIQVFEISGLDTVQPVDYVGSLVKLGAGTPTVYGLVTKELKTANEIAIATAILPTNSGTLTANGSLVNFQTQTNASGPLTGGATQIVASQAALSLSMQMTTNTNGIFTVVTLADTTLPAPSYPMQSNNHQFVSVGDGMSVSEKIR